MVHPHSHPNSLHGQPRHVSAVGLRLRAGILGFARAAYHRGRWTLWTWLLLAAGASHAADAVRLQLKWTHAFQFAGYYAAIEQGYYRDVGLDVTLLEATPGVDPVQQVLTGHAQFGVGTSSLLLSRQAGAPVVVLGVIFQHSPLVLVARKTGLLQSVHDLKGKRVMFEPHSEELRAYLAQEGLAAGTVQELQHSFNPRDLIDGRVDAMTAYVTNELQVLDLAGFAYQVYSPRAVGIDFYGDNLFTTEQEIKNHPQRVAAFRAASLKGWQYAMTHTDAVIDLILSRYSKEHSRDFYVYEAQKMAPLLQTGLIEPGYMNPGRWQHIAKTYAALGLLPDDVPLSGFLYDTTQKPRLWSPYLLATLALLIGMTVLATYILRTNRRLRTSLASLKAAQQVATESRELYRSILHASPDAIVASDLQGNITHASAAAVTMLRCTTPEQLLGRNVTEFRDPDQAARAAASVAAMFKGVYSGAEEYRVLCDDTSVLETEVNADIVRDAAGQPSGLIFVARDISERKKVQARLQHMAQHDPLTGLPNRALFTDRLQRALASALRDKTCLALMFLDLDKFKPVNDEFGHAVGDLLLQEVARRMLACVRDSDTVARIGGDEFVVVLRVVTGEHEALAVAEKIRTRLEQPFVLAVHTLGISCCIGVALYPQHGDNDLTLVKNADQAMYQAKENGRNQVQLYGAPN